MNTPPTIDRIDHIVLTVQDIDATCAFYSQVLGMRVVEFEHGRKALQFGHQKFNLHQVGKEFEPKAHTPTAGSADFCLITTAPIADVIAHVQACGVTIIKGPGRQTGAVCPLESIYLRDPDGNLVEIANEL